MIPACVHCERTKGLLLEMSGTPTWWVCVKCWLDGIGIKFKPKLPVTPKKKDVN